MKITLLVSSLLLLTLLGCNSLSPIEKAQYDNLVAQGAPPIEEKIPALAGVLNFLPGGGDIYNGEWGAFALDFLLWWPSVAWAVPQGIITANNYNKKATIAFYSLGAGKHLKFDPNKREVN